MSDTLYIVSPCYNEEEVLPITAPMYLDKLKDLIEKGLRGPDSKLLFVNDGSADKTWDIIQRLSNENSRILGLSLSRNRGHQNALLAGLMWAKDRCDVTISIDCDGQDDLDAMDEFLKNYYDGCEVVYGVRKRRDSDSFFKRFTAESFYRFMSLMGAETVFNHADYRLLGKRALEGLSEFREVNLYLRGMVPLVGYKSTSVYYNQHSRKAGKSHYPLSKMLNLAMNGITNLSVRPLHFIALLGFIISGGSFLVLIYALIRKFTGNTVTGWTSMFALVSLLGGIQMLSLGVIGEYIGKIYSEVKDRPRYIIEKTTGDPPEK